MQIQEKIKKLFEQLDSGSQKSLLKTLERKNQVMHTKLIQHPVKFCPYCQSTDFSKNGTRGSTQRYICKECRKVFTGKTGTIKHGIKNDNKFEKYFRLMFEHYMTLSEISKRIGISYQTAFDWRHKILGTLEITTDEFNGITEIDDLWFLYSQKGRKGLKYSRIRGGSHRQGDNNFQVKLLVTADREQNKDMSVLKIGRISKSDIQQEIGGKFNDSCILVSDKHRSISAFAKSEGVRHKSFLSKNHKATKEYHVQNVNNIASRLKDVVNHKFRGVSTKYLQNYANWFGQMEEIKKQANGIKKIKSTLMKNKGAWDKFTQTEKHYKDFIKKHSERTYRCPTKRSWETTISNLNYSK